MRIPEKADCSSILITGFLEHAYSKLMCIKTLSKRPFRTIQVDNLSLVVWEYVMQKKTANVSILLEMYSLRNNPKS